jgi:putative ABC transport system ATP-binding protein
VTDPTLILADEPTGDLDAKSAEEILDLLGRLNAEYGKTIVMVTHDPHAAERARRVLHLEKGALVDGAARPVAAGATAAAGAANAGEVAR